MQSLGLDFVISNDYPRWDTYDGHSSGLGVLGWPHIGWLKALFWETGRYFACVSCCPHLILQSDFIKNQLENLC